MRHYRILKFSAVACLQSLLIATGFFLGHPQSALGQGCSIGPTGGSGTGAAIVFKVFRDCNGNGMFDGEPTDKDVTGGLLIDGEMVFYQFTVQNSPGSCALSNGLMRINNPNNATNAVTPGGGIGLICSGTGCPTGAGISTIVTSQPSAYVVNILHTNLLPHIECFDNQLEAQAQYRFGTQFTATPTSPVNNDSPLCNNVAFGRVNIFKQIRCGVDDQGNTIDCAVATGYGSSASGAKTTGGGNPSFCYRITITNSGTALLTITNVTDTVFGDLTARFGASLPPGSSQTIFTNVTHSSTTMNTVTVIAPDNARLSTGCLASNYTASASATANVILSDVSCVVDFVRGGTNLSGLNPACDTNQCPNADVAVLISNQPVTNVVRVTNSGANGQKLVNCKVIVGTLTNTIGEIVVGATSNSVVGTIAASTQGCFPVVAKVVCEGQLTDKCGPIETTCNKKLQICGECGLQVTKDVACVDTNICDMGVADCSLLPASAYANSATGAVGAAFCYRVITCNTGSVALVNTVLLDPNVTACEGVIPLLNPGECVTNTCLKTWGTATGRQNNTVTATNTCPADGSALSSSDDAFVFLRTPNIICVKQVNGLDGDRSFAIPFNGSTNLTFSVRVSNIGGTDLQNIKVIDTGTSGCPASTNTIAFLAQGASTNIPLCEVMGVTCPPNVVITNVVNITAQVSTNICRVNANCDIIEVSSTCTNRATVTCQPPGICRVTGGGRQDLPRTCPRTDPSGRAIRYVTHGGQVGAPFGEETECITNNPCIRGEWQHVRHMKGGLRGNFHARSNGRENNFDSLKCVCLACFPDTIHTNVQTIGSGVCTNFDFVYNSPASTDPGKKFDLCNKDDRICGPEPRRAPANKICFSGVGDYTENKGKRTRRVMVFRVDIEDRSEPGGFHPKGSTPPPDRYRIRMWQIVGNNENSATNVALRCAVACVNPLTEVVNTTRVPDIDDGGDLDRGNHQIHPQIKPCD